VPMRDIALGLGEVRAATSVAPLPFLQVFVLEGGVSPVSGDLT